MRDLITYCADTTPLIAEVADRFPERLGENGEYLVPKIPTHRSADETLSLVRCMTQQDEDDLRSMVSLSVLGERIDKPVTDPVTGEQTGTEKWYTFTTPENQATYERVRGPLIETVDIDGVPTEITKPYMIGVIA